MGLKEMGLTGRLSRFLGLIAFLSWALATPVSLRGLRAEGVVLQTTWSTCGAAALATLLNLFGQAATEEEVLSLALKHQESLEGGLNALSLVRASEERGVPLRGYRFSLEDLRAYFARGGLPLILHVTRPELHWVVALGLVGEEMVLADPSWGRRILSLAAFLEEKGFSGVVLAPSPSPLLYLKGRASQREWLSWASLRLKRLVALGGRVP